MKAGHVIALAILCTAAGAQIAGFGQPSPFKAIEFRTIAQGNQSRIREARTDIIKNGQQWQMIYSLMVGDKQTGMTPAPILCDFKTHDLLVIHNGLKYTAGYSNYISTIRKDKATEVYVEVVNVQPGLGQAVAQVLNSPYSVTIVQKQAEPYRFNALTSYVTTSITYTGGGGGNCGNCGCACACCRSRRNSPNGNNTGLGGEICPPLPRNYGGGK
jgi:hypothetical protein